MAHLVGAPVVFDFLRVDARLPCGPVSLRRALGTPTPCHLLKTAQNAIWWTLRRCFEVRKPPFFIHKQNVGGAALAGGACSPVGVESGKTPLGVLREGECNSPCRGVKNAPERVLRGCLPPPGGVGVAHVTSPLQGGHLKRLLRMLRRYVVLRCPKLSTGRE